MFRSPFPPSHRVFFTFILSLMLLPLALHGQPDPQDLGQVRPTYQYQKTVLAVAPFNVTGTSVEMETFPRIIRNDLELSGFFKMPDNQTEVNRQNIVDNRQNSINFERWGEMGVEHYMMGRVEEDGDNYSIQVLLYDIDTRRNIINRRFVGPKAQMRDLAHQISDAVVRYLKGVEGIARTKLLYVTEQVPGVKEIAIMDADGFNARPLTSLGKLATTPAWGANGTEFYMTSYHGNRANVYGMTLQPDAAMNYRPGQMWTIAAYGGTNHSPSWNERIRRLALVLSKDGNSEIYTVQRDGSDLQRVTRSTFTDGSPAWSPDGRRIAYTTNEAGGAHIYVVNADGSGKRRVTTRGSWNDALDWSPDGQRLVFVSRVGGVNDIYVCDVSGDTTSYKRLTMNQGQNESPSWAPNGTHIAFSSNRSGTYQIYMMLDDGSNQRQLSGVGRNTMPDWGPFIGNRDND